jgi:hypothetical protein
LARGNVEEALFLLRQFAGKAGAQLATRATQIQAIAAKFTTDALTKIYQNFPATAMKCDQAASLTMRWFSQAGIKAQSLTIQSSRAVNYLQFNGQNISTINNHVAVLANGRIYDAMTGANGMTVYEYARMLSTQWAASPIITFTEDGVVLWR